MGAAEEATMRITLRQVAPNIKKVFTEYSVMWLETDTNLYLAVRFKEDTDINNPENVIVTMNSTITKRQETLPKGKSEQIDTLYDFFPYMSELFENLAKEWGISMYDVFLTAKYRGEKVEDPAESLGLAVHTKKSIVPKRAEKIC